MSEDEDNDGRFPDESPVRSFTLARSRWTRASYSASPLPSPRTLSCRLAAQTVVSAGVLGQR